MHRAHKQARGHVERDARLLAFGQQHGCGMNPQITGLDVQAVDHLGARAFLGARGGTDRIAKIGCSRHKLQGRGGEQVVVKLSHATGLNEHILGRREVAAQSYVALGNHLHLVAGQAAVAQTVVVAAVDRPVQQNVITLERQVACHVDAAAAAVEVEQAKLGLDHHGYAALRSDHSTVDQHIVGACQGDAAPGVGRDDPGRVQQHQAVEARQHALLLGGGVGDGE